MKGIINESARLKDFLVPKINPNTKYITPIARINKSSMIISPAEIYVSKSVSKIDRMLSMLKSIISPLFFIFLHLIIPQNILGSN